MNPSRPLAPALRLALVALPALALVSAGCASILARGFHKPGLSFLNASLADVSLRGATFNLNFKVDNPNSDAISLAETDYKLTVEGHEVAAGKPPLGLHIPAQGSSTVTLPATFKYTDLASSVLALLTKQSAAFRAEGHIGVQTPLGVVALPFSQEGKVDLPLIPRIVLGTPKLTGFSLGGAKLDLPITIENLNSYALPLAGLKAALRIAGSSVGEIATGDLGNLAASAKREVSVPVTLHFADALGAAQALRSGKTSMALSGKLLSDDGSGVPFELAQDVEVKR